MRAVIYPIKKLAIGIFKLPVRLIKKLHSPFRKREKPSD
jgi:hypothetical protein